MVEAARIAYRDYPTVVNEVGESGLSYDNTPAEYARMDSSMQSAQKAIGGASDVAQLAQSYYWDKVYHNIFDDDRQQYYENAVILAVEAQLAIDGCKRQFEVNVNDDLRRIRSQPCMKREKDFPYFMKWTKTVPLTKNGKDRSAEAIKNDKRKIAKRLDETIECPMNWLQPCLDKVQGTNKRNVVDTQKYFIVIPGRALGPQMSKIRNLIEDYDSYTKNIMALLTEDPDNDSYVDLLLDKSEQLLSHLRTLRISKYTMNRLVGTVLGVDSGVRKDRQYKKSSKYVRKTLNVLYQTNKELFLNNFIKSSS